MDLPAHPLLRPGIRVTRRGDGLLQVGLAMPRAVVVPDSPAVRAALQRLDTGQRPEPDDLEVARLCRELLDLELVVDGDQLLSDLEEAPLFAAYGLEAGRVRERRARHGVAVLGPASVVQVARGWLPASLGTEPAVTLLVSIGALSRSDLDPLMAAGHPHLVVQVVEGLVELGPFVSPGLTACLRCVDAHRGEADPRRSLVLEQYAVPSRRTDGVPEPVDPPVLAAAVAWAVRDCISFVDGHQPATWSRTITFGPGMADEQHQWARHPQCGCAWAELAG